MRSNTCASCSPTAASSPASSTALPAPCIRRSARTPPNYGVTLQPLPPISFAKNDVDFIDPTGVDHDALGMALNKALYNYMHGIGLDQDVRSWFAERVPKPRVGRHFIARALAGR